MANGKMADGQTKNGRRAGCTKISIVALISVSGEMRDHLAISSTYLTGMDSRGERPMAGWQMAKRRAGAGRAGVHLCSLLFGYVRICSLYAEKTLPQSRTGEVPPWASSGATKKSKVGNAPGAETGAPEELGRASIWRSRKEMHQFIGIARAGRPCH